MRVLRTAEERNNIPLVLFHAYADASERYGLEDWRLSEDHPSVAETNAKTRDCYRTMIEAMGDYTPKGGHGRWAAFTVSVQDYGAAAVYGVLNARDALYASDVGFSEHTDPAFAGLIEE